MKKKKSQRGAPGASAHTPGFPSREELLEAFSAQSRPMRGDGLLRVLGLARRAKGDLEAALTTLAEQGRLLRLRAEMKVPGTAWLEMRAVPDVDGARYEQRAVFFPKGLVGRLYWLAVLPFHGAIFAGMAARITSTAEAPEAEPRRG